MMAMQVFDFPASQTHLVAPFGIFYYRLIARVVHQ